MRNLCLADRTGAGYCQSPTKTRACCYQELIDPRAGGEPHTQQEQHIVPCLFIQWLQEERGK